ncbi:MAG: glyoxalase/bleomycin resistance/extradiol dioxygenase family protein [Burkholderiaceae bacterium]
MHKQIYVNLAVDDLPKSRAFFESLGLGFNPQFSNESGACLVLGDNIFAMLLTKEFFKGFTGKPLVDARQGTEMLLCLSCEGRTELDAIVAKALAAGGSAPRPPVDNAFMYSHGFEDLDGHIWELVHMNPNPACAA